MGTDTTHCTYCTIWLQAKRRRPRHSDPIPTELDLLEKARAYTNQYSYREVANWLSTNSGRYISHVGLRKRLQHERQRKNQAASLRKWAEYAEKAISKAKEIEEEQEQKPQVDIQDIEYETEAVEEHANVLFKPNLGPQTDFLAASEREVLYGGSAGGGKSYAMLADPLRYMGASTV